MRVARSKIEIDGAAPGIIPDEPGERTDTRADADQDHRFLASGRSEGGIGPYERSDRIARLQGEGAPYTGLKPAETDFGPAIPAAEKALEMGKANDLTGLMMEEVAHGIAARYRDAMVHSAVTKEPAGAADVAAARERVSAELAFIGYVEGIYLAAKGGMHVGVAATPDHHQGME